MAAWLLSSGVAMCVDACGLATSCCKTHCNGCMNALAFFWGGSRSTKPCVFPCKVASAGDEGYLVCAAGAVWIVSSSIGSSSVFCNEWLFLCAWFYAFLEFVFADLIGMAAWLLSSGIAMCVDACGLATSCCKTHCNGCMNVAWSSFSKYLSKVLQNLVFSALASRSGFGAAVSEAVARSSFVFCKLSLCRSHCSGCVKVARCRGCMRNASVFSSWTS